MAGSLSKGYIGKEDLSIQTNTAAAETFNRLASAGSTISLTKIPDIWDGTGKIKPATAITRNYLSYYSSLSAAVAGVNSLNEKTLYIDNGNCAVDANLDLSAYTSVQFVFLGGSLLSPALGVTITLPSPSNIVASPNQQIFSGAGTVAFNLDGTVYPQMWGAIADETTDCASAIQAALNATGKGVCYFPPGGYRLASGVSADGASTIFDIHMDGWLVPDSGIGVALSLNHIIAGTMKLKVSGGGGNTADVAFSAVHGVGNCTFDILGWVYDGTVWNVTGDGCNLNKITSLLSISCYRAMLHGYADATYTEAAAHYDYIFDYNSEVGSQFRNCNDVTIVHYENAFYDTTHTLESLYFHDVGSFHIGMLALGGQADYFLYFDNANKVGIDKLFLNSEDANVSSGMYTVNASKITISQAHIYSCAFGINVSGGTEDVTVLCLREESNTTPTASAGVDLGFPASGIGMFATWSKQDLVNHYSYGTYNLKYTRAIADNLYDIGEKSLAFKGIVVKDTANGNYYRICSTNGAIALTLL